MFLEQKIRMIYGGSCDINAENSALPSQKQITFKSLEKFTILLIYRVFFSK